MKDLTAGPIAAQILVLAAPMAIGMLVQTLYFMVGLYFVARLGDTALAGVSAAASFNVAVLALTQMLGVGTVTLISHAVGDRDGASLVFNQSLVLAALCALAALAGGLAFAGPSMAAIGADAATVAAGTVYLHWFVPGLALQFAMVAMGSALRGTGIAKPTMLVQLATVLLNIVLAPVLIAGLGTGRPLGVAGAGLASTLAVADGTLLGCGLMLLLTLLCQWPATAMVGFFTADAAARTVGGDYLRLTSWNFVCTGLVFTCSGMFQALGNTWPSIQYGGTRLATFVLPVLVWSRRPGFRIGDVWYLSIATVTLQALISVLLLRRELRVRLAFGA